MNMPIRERVLGLSIMPAEIQKVINTSLMEFLQAQANIDDNLMVSKGNRIEHVALCRKGTEKIGRCKLRVDITKKRICKSQMWVAGIKN